MKDIVFEKRNKLCTHLIYDGYISVFESDESSIFNIRAGVYDADGNYDNFSSQLGGRFLAARVVTPQYIEPNETAVFEHRKVLYMGVFVPQWGHFLIDMIYRLYNIDEYEDYQIAYCGKSELIGNYMEFLELLGVSKNRLIYVEQTTKFDEIIVNEPCEIPTLYYSDAYKRIIQTVIKNALKQANGFDTYKNIYFSRLHFPEAKKKEVGEETIEKVFKSNGYKVLYPEKLSVIEQIYYIYNSENVAMISGTIGHNIIFKSQGGYCILEKTSLLNYSQMMLEQMMLEDHNIYIRHIPIYKELCRLKPYSYGSGPFLFSVTQELRDYFDEVGFKYDSIYRINIINSLKYLVLRALIYWKQCFKWLYHKGPWYTMINEFRNRK